MPHTQYLYKPLTHQPGISNNAEFAPLDDAGFTQTAAFKDMQLCCLVHGKLMKLQQTMKGCASIILLGNVSSLIKQFRLAFPSIPKMGLEFDSAAGVTKRSSCHLVVEQSVLLWRYSDGCV